MQIFKCKMCGGTLEIAPDATVGVCEYCGTKQTLPRLDDDKKANLYDRANHFRRNNDYDKAMGIYERILNEDSTDAECYWSLVLCRYGIEYVEDPVTHRRVPTVNRTQYTSIFADEDYKAALKYADSQQKELYEQEAKYIDEVQRNILDISQKEDPFDIFICYKETDENGRRTRDSVLANDLYQQLTQEGYRVFFSRISLEDKLGTAYEPYIFAALHSARVMVVLGTKPEYFNAVWVKNEWGRFLGLISQGQKKTLIPAYRDMDPYDLPEEFSHLQAQDMNKLGFMQDLIRGIRKIIGIPGASAEDGSGVSDRKQTSTGALTKRGYLYLEDEDFKVADEYFERALDENPEDSAAYMGKVLAGLKLSSIDTIENHFEKVYSDKNFEKAVRFASGDEKTRLEHLKEIICEKWKQEQLRKEQEQADKLVLLKQKRDQLMSVPQNRISAGDNHTAGLRADGTVVAAGENEEGQCDISDWTNIVSISAGTRCTVGLRADGTLVVAGSIWNGMKDWTDLVAVSIGQFVKLGLHSNGTVSARGNRHEDAENWTDIVAVSAKFQHMVGLQLNGTVVASGYNEDGQCDVEDWADIVAVSAGFYHTVGLRSDGTVVAVGENKSGQCNVMDWTDIKAVSAGFQHTVGLRSDGTVVATGDNRFGQCNVTSWTDIIALSAGTNHTVGLRSNGEVVSVGKYHVGVWNLEETRMEEESRIQHEQQQRKKLMSTVGNMIATGISHTVGLRSNGTVIAAGDNQYGQCNVTGWTDIVAVAAGDTFTIGLRSDGTVVAVGADVNLDEKWNGISSLSAAMYDIVGLRADGTVITNNGMYINNIAKSFYNIEMVSASGVHIVGLRSDGTVVATGYGDEGQCNVQDWKNIIAISAGASHTVGLCLDGTVVAVGATADYSNNGQCSVEDWHDIVMVAAGWYHTVGLCSDGTVVAVGNNEDGQCNVQSWRNIVAVFAGLHQTVGICSDGRVVAVGQHGTGVYDAGGWRLFNSLDKLEQEMEEGRRALKVARVQEDEARKQRLKDEYSSLQTELANLKGLFTGKRRKQIEVRLQEINNLLEQ